MMHLWPVESDDADPADRPNGDRQSSSRRSQRGATGLPPKPSSRVSKMTGLTEYSSGPSWRALLLDR